MSKVLIVLIGILKLQLFIGKRDLMNKNMRVEKNMVLSHPMEEIGNG